MIRLASLNEFISVKEIYVNYPKMFGKSLSSFVKMHHVPDDMRKSNKEISVKWVAENIPSFKIELEIGPPEDIQIEVVAFLAAVYIKYDPSTYLYTSNHIVYRNVNGKRVAFFTKLGYLKTIIDLNLMNTDLQDWVSSLEFGKLYKYKTCLKSVESILSLETSPGLLRKGNEWTIVKNPNAINNKVDYIINFKKYPLLKKKLKEKKGQIDISQFVVGKSLNKRDRAGAGDDTDDDNEVDETIDYNEYSISLQK